ncbi:alpha/beta hydrolase family protein [Herbiconiux daphne]|uniref:Prolyl oligopeptidase family serine peptidase n=1 Tax=Herbiconiux daphne TaxID=2970914 RepID=A0ABT2GYF6_9MICO|nr:prolyl oligopeptidase family serine peptidase [Herbiconiux daphne]MCS5732901.1 prolyl oligopeptidase family serine peptidase [Herbiconiux daphne]
MTATAAGPAGPDRTLRYGPGDDQHLSFSVPRGQARGTVVLIHGGYWRAPFTADLMRPLVPEFTDRGWAVANVEYRRGRAGWPAMRDDLASALALARSQSSDARLAIFGHSVGGQLALLGGEPGDAIVALAPVTDLARGYREGIGEGAVAEFFGERPDAIAETYAAASPLAQLPPRGEVMIVHGADDARVPVGHTRDYLVGAQAAGARASLLELPQLSHLDAIAPDAPHWPKVHAWLGQWAGR